jgi:hypothetical protein
VSSSSGSFASFDQQPELAQRHRGAGRGDRAADEEAFGSADQDDGLPGAIDRPPRGLQPFDRPRVG